MSSISAIILTLNEELHLERCLKSLDGVVQHIIVVDSFSTDNTKEIALRYGAHFVQRKFTNHAEQFNWALENIKINSEWILRIDADEILQSDVGETIQNVLKLTSESIAGFTLNRSIVFQGNMVKYGGVGKRKILRLFRYGKGMCEYRLMDEHIIVKGSTEHLNISIVDHNLKSLTWWINKHNAYATNEAIETLLPSSNDGSIEQGKMHKLATNTRKVRQLKQSIYLKISPGFRVLVFFIYRYFIRLGFLDWRCGVYHILTAFWYRLLIDLKICEIRRTQSKESIGIEEAVRRVLSK